jgi:hypothetical protein
MKVTRLKPWIVPCLVIAVVIDGLSILPDSIQLFSTFIVTTVAIISGVIITMYYESLPSQKKTILLLLMELLMILNSIFLMQNFIVVQAIRLIPESIQTSLDNSPNLMCSIISQEQNLAIIFNCIFLIVCFKTMAAIMPAEYLSMNHNRVWTVTYSLMIVLWVLEYAFYLFYYGSWCNKHNIYNLKTFYGLIVDNAKIKLKPATLVVHMTAGSVPQTIKFIGYLWKRLKSRKSVNHRRNKIDLMDILEHNLFKKKAPSSSKYLIQENKTGEDTKNSEYQNNSISLGIEVEDMILCYPRKTDPSNKAEFISKLDNKSSGSALTNKECHQMENNYAKVEHLVGNVANNTIEEDLNSRGSDGVLCHIQVEQEPVKSTDIIIHDIEASEREAVKCMDVIIEDIEESEIEAVKCTDVFIEDIEGSDIKPVIYADCIIEGIEKSEIESVNAEVIINDIEASDINPIICTDYIIEGIEKSELEAVKCMDVIIQNVEVSEMKPVNCSDIIIQDIEEGEIEQVNNKAFNQISIANDIYKNNAREFEKVEVQEKLSNHQFKTAANRTKEKPTRSINSLSEDENNLIEVKINNFIPRTVIEKTKACEESKTLEASLSNIQKTPKPQLLNTDYVIWLGTIAVILAIFTIFFDSENNSVIMFQYSLSRIFFFVMPTYWIIRSEEKTKFIKRRFNRFVYRYRF